jgi:uncharacterized protein with ACT and thioredoxin-like domain
MIKYSPIVIPDSELNRCHSYVQEKLMDNAIDFTIATLYMNINNYRNLADYNLSELVTFNHFSEVKVLKNDLMERIIGKRIIFSDEAEQREKFKQKKKRN